MGKIISVASGKGGVGKSNISINLSYALANLRKKILIFDSDFGLNNIDLYLNLSPEYNIIDYLQGRKTLKEIVASKTPHIDVISGNSGCLDMSNLSSEFIQKIKNVLARYKSEYDFIVIDSAPGIANQILEFCCASDMNVVVTTPEYPSLIDSFQLIKILLKEKQYNKSIFLILNMSENKDDAFRKYLGINSVLNKQMGKSIKYGGHVDKSKIFNKCLLKQTSVYESSGFFKKQFDNIALSLLKEN